MKLYDIILCVTPNHFIIMFVEFSHMEKKDFPRVTLVFEDGKWVGAHKMILAASSCVCAAAWQKRHPHPLIFMRGIQSNILEAFDLRGLCLMLGFTALLFTRPGRCVT